MNEIKRNGTEKQRKVWIMYKLCACGWIFGNVTPKVGILQFSVPRWVHVLHLKYLFLIDKKLKTDVIKLMKLMKQ